VQIQSEEGVSADDFNIVHTIGVSLYEYVYGVSYTLKHLSGDEISIQTIPIKNQVVGTRSRLIISGKGFPHWIDDKLHYGDLIVEMYPVLKPDVFMNESVKTFMNQFFR